MNTTHAEHQHRPEAAELRMLGLDPAAYPDLHLKRARGCEKCLTTGLKAELTAKEKKRLRDLGIQVVETWDPEVSILVASKVSRTLKFLVGIAYGIPIVVDCDGTDPMFVDQK